ncbi:MAG: anhydro-N-acetylmuramic acid kinase [Pelagibacterales bacterium]|nr:anhydro-N-acetylmuramic acid kinase [Pelagibacterales bacterium]
MTKLYRAIGLMSGTSMDGIDLALIESNGKDQIIRKNFAYSSYKEEFKQKLRDIIYKSPNLQQIKLVENELTLLHAELVNKFLEENKIDRSTIDLIAFHGHTILHIPHQEITWQIGNGHLLANKTKINVVCDFRSKDVILGGQGAPLVPIYHFYLLSKQEKPAAVLNIGGISNITYFGSENENEIEAFDICFGNAPFDDLMKERFNKEFDDDGALSLKGKVDFILADRILQNDIFHKKPPKSFDRNDFSTLLAPIKSLRNTEDTLATFAYMHAKSIQFSIDFLSQKPKEIFVCGGGRKNIALMDEMRKWLSGIKIKTIEEINLNGDAIEAEAFAFLGIRSILELPIGFNKTTGVKLPSFGGVIYRK